MASGTINGTTSNKYIDSKIEWSSTPSNANNNSSVTASLWYRRNNTYSGTPTSGTGTFGITIDGQSGSTTFSLTIPNSGAWVKAVTVTKTVSHNNDGRKSITISASGSIPVASLSSTTCSGTAVLDGIPRQATITSATDFNDEGNPSFTFTNLANAPMTCWLEPNPIGDHLCERTLSGASGTYTWTLTDDERKQLRTACKGKSCTCRIGLYSTIGGVQYSSFIDKTLSIVNGNPTFTESQVSYADISSAQDITGNPQHIVQNQSRVEVFIEPASANKEATITQYSATLNGRTITREEHGAFDFGVINSSQDLTLSVAAMDSRGNVTVVAKTIKVLPWSPPIFTASLERLNNYEDTTYLTVDASVSSVNGKNTMDISYQIKESGGEYDNIVYHISNKTENTITCDKNKAYIFKITVIDAFDSVTTEYALSKGKFPLFIETRRNAVGINDFPAEGEALRVAEGVAHFQDGVKINGETVADFLVEQGTSGIWIYEKWNSGICKLYANIYHKASNTGNIHLIYDYPFRLTGEPIININITRNESVCSRVTPADLGGNYSDMYNKLDVSFYDVKSTVYMCYASVQVIGTWK